MAAHVAVVVVRLTFRPEAATLRDLMAVFDAGNERTLAAWWTAALLAGAAAAAVLVAELARRADSSPAEVRAWRVLAVVFALLSLDEIVSLHERGAAWTASVLDAGSPLVRLGWMIPAAAILVLSLVVLVPAFRAIPRRPRRIIVAGLGTAVAGALGMEFVNVMLVDAGAALRWRYLAMAVEEAAEMGGVVIVLAGISLAVRGRYSDGSMVLTYQSRDAAGTR